MKGEVCKGCARDCLRWWSNGWCDDCRKKYAHTPWYRECPSRPIYDTSDGRSVVAHAPHEIAVVIHENAETASIEAGVTGVCCRCLRVVWTDEEDDVTREAEDP